MLKITIKEGVRTCLSIICFAVVIYSNKTYMKVTLIILSYYTEIIDLLESFHLPK